MRKGFLLNKKRTVPMAINKGAHLVNFNATNCPVIVVPILAPNITPAAWYRFIKPALTNPTTITVVAELLWIAADIIAPVIIPFTGLLVIFSNKPFSLFPATFWSASPIIFIP